MSFIQLLHQAISRTYEGTLFIVAIYAVFCYKKVDKGTRYICMLIWLGVVTESLARFAAAKFRNNMPVYNISCLFEFAIICLYFHQSISHFSKWKIGIIVAITGILLGIMNILVFQPLNTINTNFLLFECLGIVCLSLYAIYRMLMATDIWLFRETHFWIPCTLLFYQCGTLWNWGIYDYVVTKSVEKAIFLNISILVINIITYCSFAAIFFFYPKMRRTHV